MFLPILSYLEHSRSLRPSILLAFYLFFSLLFDAVSARTFLLNSSDSAISRLFTGALGLKGVITVLESVHKTKWMLLDDSQRSPEERSGLFSLSTYFWMNPLIFEGYQKGKVFSINDLYTLDESLESEKQQKKFMEAWGASTTHGQGIRLIYGLVAALRWNLVAPALPRLARTA